MKTALAILLFSAGAFAVPGIAFAGTNALTLEECLRLADENHPSLEAARSAVAAAARGVDEARSAWWPEIDGAAGYHRWQRRAFLPEGILPPGRVVPAVIGPLDDWNAGLTARATLFDFGERAAGVDAANARHQAAQADAAGVRLDLHLAVERTFYGLAAADELEDVAARGMERAEAGLRLAQARREAGAVPPVDVLRMQAEVASARVDVISARSRSRIAAGRLNVAMGRPVDTPVAIETGSASEGPMPEAADAMKHALQFRPELESARRQLAAAEAALRGSRASRYAHVRADGAVGWRDVDFLPETHEWQAGISIDLPIFDAGRRRSRTGRARAERDRAAAMVEQLELRIQEDVWTTAAERDRARAALAASEALARDRAESLRVVRARYEAGGVLVTDLLETQTALAAAEAGVAVARWDVFLADAAYARAAALALGTPAGSALNPRDASHSRSAAGSGQTDASPDRKG